MKERAVRATLWGLAMTGLHAVLIIVGSRNLTHFDAALVAYTFSVLFATFGLTYRYAMWLQRPPTCVYCGAGSVDCDVFGPDEEAASGEGFDVLECAAVIAGRPRRYRTAHGHQLAGSTSCTA